MNSSQEPSRKRNIFLILFFVVVIPIVTVVAFVFYTKFDLSSTTMTGGTESQEQFSGAAMVSEQQQSECQKSANRIIGSANSTEMLNEYKQNTEACRDVFIVNEKENQFRKEGMYLDLIVDIANTAAATDKSKAVDALVFSKNLTAWDFYMGPVSCDSKSVLEAHIESLALSGEKTCIKSTDYAEALTAPLRKKDLSILSSLVDTDSVVWLGYPDSDAGCPEKLSTVVKIIEKAASANNVDLEEINGEDKNTISFIYKTKTEDKIILEFSQVKGCLKFTDVLLTGLQENE